MAARSILIVAVDGLRASALGAYGNTTFSTPALDDLAAESSLFDFCYAPAAELAANYRALWKSVHPLRPDNFAASAAPLPRLLAERGYATTLATDEPHLLELPIANQFDKLVSVFDAADRRALDISETSMARLFVKGCDVIETPFDRPQMIWLHARGMTGPWDAPLELQLPLQDENDPPPAADVNPPDLLLSDADDPDTAFRHGVAYAAQVMVLDACWQLLHEAVASISKHGEWLVMLIGVRGLPLGENRRIGGIDPQLGVGQAHVPWLIKLPEGKGRLGRTDALVSPLDLLPTLLQLTDVAQAQSHAANFDGKSTLPLMEPAGAPWRDGLVSGAATPHRAFRTTGWSLRYEVGQGVEGAELFVRPDDRWEANDVASRCPDIVDALLSASEETVARIQAGDRMPDERLPEALRTAVS